MAPLHAGALRDPLVAGIDQLFKIFVGEDAWRHAVPDARDGGAVSAQPLSFRSARRCFVLLLHGLPAVVITAMLARKVRAARMLALRARGERHAAQLPGTPAGPDIRFASFLFWIGHAVLRMNHEADVLWPLASLTASRVRPANERGLPIGRRPFLPYSCMSWYCG